MDNVDFIVIGGGIVGLCAAIAMRQRGYSVTLLEAGTFASIETASRVYAINHASQTLLQELNIWQHLDETHIAPYERMHVWDALNQASIDFDARMMACDRLGVMLEESVLKALLIQQAHFLDIQLVEHWQTQSIDIQDLAISVYSPERVWHGQWLIVADGARSATRDLLGVDMVTWPYHQQAIVAKVRTERAHQKTAFQIFCPQGPLAFLPLACPEESSIVWSTSIPHAKALMAESDAVFEALLTETFEHKLGHTTLLSARKTFFLHMQHVKQYTGPRWVLMGDAAHTVHPLAGLGLNIGLADLAIWLRNLPQQGRPLPTQRIQGLYQRQRKHALWQMILFLQAMHLLFTQSYLPIKTLRGIGLTLCNRLPLVKRLLIEHATGLA